MPQFDKLSTSSTLLIHWTSTWRTTRTAHTITRKLTDSVQDDECAHIQFASFDTRTEFIAFDLSLLLQLFWLCIVYLFVRFLLFCFVHIVVDCFYQHAVGSAARRQLPRADGRTDGRTRSIFNGCNMDTFCVRQRNKCD